MDLVFPQSMYSSLSNALARCNRQYLSADLFFARDDDIIPISSTQPSPKYLCQAQVVVTLLPIYFTLSPRGTDPEKSGKLYGTEL
jgi:hypothetical protein